MEHKQIVAYCSELKESGMDRSQAWDDLVNALTEKDILPNHSPDQISELIDGVIKEVYGEMSAS